MCARNPVECVVPPYITERLARCGDPAVRSRALANLASDAAFRAFRIAARALPSLMVSPSPEGGKHRLVYDAKHRDRLPGSLVRAEGQPAVSDPAVDEAYDYSGDTYDFYEKLFGRNSLDGNGMTLISSVHVAEADGEPLNNAFWNGEQMAYGDGDGVIFQRFTRSRDVVGHELAHGVQAFASNLDYFGQSGALNEHFSDVFGVLVRQWRNGESATKASWLVGEEVLIPAPTRRAIRDMEKPGTAFVDDPYIGTDPQPAHMDDFYSGPLDRGGVHINSGIPNRAFVLAAKALKGKAWEVAGRIWYHMMLQLTSASRFPDCARLSVQIAGDEGAAAKKAVKAAWDKVGVTV